jgi:hypothetical protein
MAAKYGNIRNIAAVSLLVLAIFFAIAAAQNPTENSQKLSQFKPPAGKIFTSLDNIESPYQILSRNRGQQGGQIQPQLMNYDGTSQAFSLGPVIATAKLSFKPATNRNNMSYLALNRSETTSTRPAELRETPADAPAEPAYFQVKVGEKDIRGLTYRSKKDIRLVKLLLDTNSDGLFSDEREYLGTWLGYIQVTVTYYFGPVATRHGNAGIEAGSFVTQCSNGKWLVCYPAIYREGQVALDGKTYKIALVDNDFDGKYNRTFVPPAKSSREPGCDAFAIDLDGDSKFNFRNPGESELMPLSRLIKINDTYYNLEVAEDGGTIEFRQAVPQYGQIDFGSEQVDARLWSDTACQWLQGSGIKRVPAGRYGAVMLELTERDASADKYVFSIDKGGAGQLSDFEVRPGETTSFKFGPPFQIKTSMERSGENVMLSFSLKGQGGELYKPGGTVNGKEIPVPQFKIIDESGQVVHTGQFQYG